MNSIFASKFASPHIAIRASAGSGKTFQLTNRYIKLILRGEQPERILATTFTRKAAGEIQGRVLTRLAEAVLNDTGRGRLAKELDCSLSYEQAASALTRMARAVHRVQVSTIDAFFVSIAKVFALELGFSPQWQIVDEPTADTMRVKAVEATLQGEPNSVLSLVLVLSKGYFNQSVAALVRETVGKVHDTYLDAPASAWFALSPGNPPDAAWLEEILRLLEDAYANARTTMSQRMAEALLKDIQSARSGNWSLLLSRGLTNKVLSGSVVYANKPIPDEVIDHLESLIEQVRAIILTSLVARGHAMYRLLATFDEHLRKLQHKTHALRFSDVTRALSTASLLGRLDEVFFRLDSQIHHLLLDEFQDTSLAQWQVLKPLSKEIAAEATGHRSLLLVGDVKQAIYGWRGGVADIFDSLHDDIHGLDWIPMNRSYRSSPVIMETVNRIFEKLVENQALSKDLDAARAWQTGFQKHETACEGLKGYVRLEVAPLPEEGDKHKIGTLKRGAEIASFWASICPQATIGVLTRSNDAVRRLIYELRRRNVRASEEGGNPITDSPAVNLILSLMRLADHPGDSIARFHVAHSVLGQALDLQNDARSAARVARKIREDLMNHGYGPCVYRWSKNLSTSCDVRESRRLGQLVRLAHRHDAHPSMRTDDFVASVEAERVVDPLSANVRVMTIHKAKGLEFDIVVLPELDVKFTSHTPSVLVESPTPTSPPTKVVPYAKKEEQAVLPALEQMAAKWRAGQVREGLCTLYVAVTRPVHALVMVISSEESKTEYPSTLAGVLKSSLAKTIPSSPGKILFELGDNNFFESLKHENKTESTQTPQEITSFPMQPSSRLRGLIRTSPSSLAEQKSIALADWMRLDTKALRKGSVIHALFEQITWLDEFVIDDTTLIDIARKAGATTSQCPQLLKEFRGMLAMPEVQTTLIRLTYETAELKAEVHRELPFAIREGDTLMTGAMDRVVVRKFGDSIHDVEVLDFKTDKIDENNVDARVEHYRSQLEAYRRAAAQVFDVHSDQVRSRLIFVRAGLVRDVE